MNLEPFFATASAYVGKYFPTREVHILERETRGIGGWLTICWRELRFCFTVDKGAYAVEVGIVAEPSRWYDGQTLLLVMNGVAYAPGQVHMLTQVDEFGDLCDSLLKQRDTIADMFSGENLAETKRKYSERQQQVTQQIFDLSDKNKKGG